MSVLAMDIGSTQWKAGIYDDKGWEMSVHRIPAPALTDAQGFPIYDPEGMKSSLRSLISAQPKDLLKQVTRIALAGMAEAGLLMDSGTGEALSPILPWYDKRGIPVFDKFKNDPLFQDRYTVTGLPGSGKYSIYKLLALKDGISLPAERLRWLGAVEYAAWLFTGEAATVNTLAARTYAYDIVKKKWDYAFLESLGLPGTIFPQVYISGEPMGLLKKEWSKELGLPSGISVCICGHDHLCAAFGAHALTAGKLFSSMGTAQVLLGVKSTPGLNKSDMDTGLSFGPMPLGGGQTVLGSVQSAGSSVTTASRLLYGEQGYDSLMRDAARSQDEPSGLVYFPYLSGSGAPHMNSFARGGFLGISTGTTREQMLLAVYEGIAFESKLILKSFGRSVHEMTACGGLTAHRRLMQVMADVLCLPIRVLEAEECTLYGVASLAYRNAGIMLPMPAEKEAFMPRPEISAAYESIYQKSYLPLQKALLSYYGSVRE